MRTGRVPALAFATIAAVVAAGRGCSSSQQTHAPSVSPPVATAPADAGATEAAPISQCPADAGPPDGVPQGWVRWDGYDPCCGFYIPSSPQYLPEPIAWQACDATVQPAGLACKQMLVDWTVSPAGDPFTFWISTSLDDAQNLTIQVSRMVGNYVLRVIGAADGALSQAILETKTNVCTGGRSSLGGGRYSYQVLEGGSFVNGGLLGGAVGDRVPTALEHFSDGLVHDNAAGAPGVLDFSAMRLYSWAPGSPSQIIAVPTLGNAFEQVFMGDVIGWTEGNTASTELRVWTAALGASNLVSFGGDTSSGAADLGGDGHDLVWVQGSGRTDSTSAYPVVSIMTSPFVADPQKLAPRRVRSEEAQYYATAPFVVGCGWAARQLPEGIRVVRLADGVSWLLSSDQALNWRWDAPFALTCTELFAKVEVRVDGAPPITTYARARLDSLGPGAPAD